jgi:hypothetical protein
MYSLYEHPSYSQHATFDTFFTSLSQQSNLKSNIANDFYKILSSIDCEAFFFETPPINYNNCNIKGF